MIGDSVQGTPRGAHIRNDVQGLRALAVIAVVLFHVGLFLPGGFVGVDMFFVISGFVIMLTLFRAYQRDGKISLKQFYVRRFRRLAPALAVVIVFTLFASALVLSPLGTQQNAALTGLAAAISLGNVAIALTTGNYFDAPAELNPFLHTWSLAVEEQFYLVFPLAVIIGLLIRHNKRSKKFGVGLVVGVGTAVSFIITIAHPYFPGALATTQLFGFYSPVTRAWEFGVGALVALWLMGKKNPFRIATVNGLYLAGFALLGVSFFLITGQLEFPGWLTLLPVAGTAALIVAGRQPSFGNSLLSTKPFTLVGDWSYSIYLWHWPFVSLAKVLWEGNEAAAPLAALVSFIPAIAAYYLVEQKFRYRSFDSGKKLAGAVAVFVGVPATLAALFWLVPTAAFGDELKRAIERPVGYGLGCHVEPSRDDGPGVCYWPADDSAPAQPPLYLVGDSNAAHYADGLVIAAEKDNRALTVMTARVCPFLLDGGVSAAFAPNPELCQHWQEEVGKILRISPPGVVIMSAADSYWLAEAGPLRLAGESLTPSAQQTIDELEEGIRDTVTTLTSYGHHVVLVHTLPHWQAQYYWDLDDCSLFEVLNGCHEYMSTDFYFTRSGDVRQAVIDGSRRGATVVDLTDVVCPGGMCETRGDGYWIYRDDNHISGTFSRELAPLWSDILAENTVAPRGD